MTTSSARSGHSSLRSAIVLARSCCPASRGSARPSCGRPASRRHATHDIGSLPARGVEAEASLSFAGLSELLSPVLDETISLLVPPRQRALEVALLLAEPGDVAPDAHAIGLAVHDVVCTLAQRGPVVVAVDDMQWLDPASAHTMQIAFRRLQAERVGLLGTLRRTPERRVSSFELDGGFAEGRIEQLTVGPLSPSAIHSLLRDRLGLELTRPELARVQEATAGNPFFALELGRELIRTNTRPTPGQPLRVPQSLRELLGGRLAQLPADTVDVLLQVSALARPTVELVAAAHGSRERVLGALETAGREGVVELDESRLRFVHPLLSSICYEQAPLWKRRAVHRALAGVVSDVEERARHLAVAVDGPDAAVASRAPDRGRTGRRPRGHRCRRGTLRAGRRVDTRRSTARSAETPAISALPPSRRRGRSSGADARPAPDGGSLRCRAGGHPLRARRDVQDEVRGDERAVRGGGGRSSGRRCTVRADPGPSQPLSPSAVDVRGALTDAHAALERAERVGDPGLLAAAIARVGHAESWGAEITPGLLERGAALEDSFGLELEFNESPGVWLGRQLMRRGEIDRPRVIFEALEAKAAVRGDEVTRTLLLWYRSLVDWYAGHWERALAIATEATEFGHQAQFAHNPAWVGRVRGLLEADLGLVDAARVSANEALDASRGDEYFTIQGLGVLGRLELELGNTDEAATHLARTARTAAGGWPERPGAPDLGRCRGSTDLAGRARRGACVPPPLRTPRTPDRESLGNRRGPALPRPSCLPLSATSTAAFTAFDRALTELGERTYPLERAPHAAVPRDGPPAGWTEKGGTGRTGGGVRDLRGARRAPVGREGAARAAPDQRPRAWRPSSRRRSYRSPHSQPKAGPTRRSPPSCTWASARSRRTSRTSTASWAFAAPGWPAASPSSRIGRPSRWTSPTKPRASSVSGQRPCGAPSTESRHTERGLSNDRDNCSRRRPHHAPALPEPHPCRGRV